MARCLVRILLAVAVPFVACGCISMRSLLVGELDQVVVEESPRWFERNRIALVDVDGFIGLGDGASMLWSGTTVADVREKLERAAADGRVRAVVLRINSPGGSAAASDMIYEDVTKFRQSSGKPVVASLVGTAASGGYYVALASDRIVAAPTTVTGSVGVIMHFINVEGLYGKIGLRSEVIKSGARKDIGSPTRSLTAEEREILQGVNKAFFDRFLSAMRQRRTQMTEQDVAIVSDGRILTADQAIELNMIDQIGYPDDAVAAALELANIRSADVILYRAFPHYNANIYASAGGTAKAIEQGLEELLRGRGPMFLYLWSPGL
jgi:protease-4